MDNLVHRPLRSHPVFHLVAAFCCVMLAHCLVCSAAVVVYVSDQGSLFGLSRPDINDPVSALEALATPPSVSETGQQLSSGVLPGTKVLALQTEGDTTTVEFSPDIIGSGLDEVRLTTVFEQVRATLRQFGLEGSIRLRSAGSLLSDYLPPVKRVAPSPSPKGIIANVTGALAGRSIALSPGHGYFWNGGGWHTQRSVYCAPLNEEDFHNLEEMIYLNTYLTQDGATTKPYRCLDKSAGNHSSGHPWWQMGAYVWLQNLGYPCSVYASATKDCTTGTGADEGDDDVRARPLASDRDNTDIYVSLHSNGYIGDCTGSCPTGTETYYDDSSEHATWGAASHTLATDINNAIMAALTANVDSTWTCHGACVKDSYGDFGEIRIPDRPATLTELAFHDTCDRDADANHLRDNFFRSAATWGMYKGICDYFGVTPTWAFYSDELVSHDIPTSMDPGATATVHITFRNRGVLWNDARGFQLGAVGDADPFTTTTRYAVGGEVGPNTTKTFTLTFTAPTTPGIYTTDWQMVRQGVAWFGAKASVSVTVGEVGYPATWGPATATTVRTIYTGSGGSLGSGTPRIAAFTTGGETARLLVGFNMATAPDASLVSGGTFVAYHSTYANYSSSTTSDVTIYQPLRSWTSSATWITYDGTNTWSTPGGTGAQIGSTVQSFVGNPSTAVQKTWTWAEPTTPASGILMKGTGEGNITYRKGVGAGAEGPNPTLTLTYTTPTPTIRSWAYLGWYDQGTTTDRQLRIDTDQAAGTYGGVPVTEATMAPAVGGTSYGNSYGIRQWAQGTYTNDLVNLNSSYFYNAVHESAVTYCFVYVYNSKGSSITGAYLGIGSDDSCKVWWNGTVVGSDIIGRGVAADSDFWGPITINNGWNRLLVKVENGTTGHGVYARFANANRTALTDKAYLSFYTTDSTAPSEPTGLAVAGVTSGVWQNTVAAPTFTWTSGADTQGGGEGVSGVRGQKHYFGSDLNGSPDTFQTGTSFAPGAQADGAYYFKVSTIDGALNESGAVSFAFLYDATPPNAVTGFGSSTPGSSDTDWYNSTDDLTWTWTEATDATSGLDGYAIVQDTSPTTVPGATKTHNAVTSYTLAGPQNSGEYWLHVRSKDVAGNWLAGANTAHRRIRIDRTAPTGVSLGFSTITTDSIAVTGSGTDVHSGINPSTGYNYSRDGASGSGAKGATHTWTGLSPNTQYSGFTVTVSDQAVPTPNTAASSPQSQWSLSAAPVSGSITPDNPSPAQGDTVTWTAAGGFGAGSVQYYRYAFDTSAMHTWADGEPQWSSGSLATVPASGGTWYLHVKGYNGADVANGAYDYPLAVTPVITCSQTNAVAGVAVNLDGTFTITFIGTPQAQYYVVTSPDVAAPMSNWVALAGSTNAVTNASGEWQVTATNTAVQQYYRSTAVTPCP